MNSLLSTDPHRLAARLAEAEATIRALLAGEIDAVIDPASRSPLLLCHAQAALRESEERYRQIVDTAYEGIFTVGLDGTCTFANQRFADLLGYAVAEVTGRPIIDFMTDDDVAGLAQALAQPPPAPANQRDVTFRRTDGAALWGLLRITPLHNAEGRSVGTLGMLTDRTRFREAEEALRSSEAQYRQIVETTADGVIKADARNVIVFVNQRLAEMLGYEPSEMIGRSLLDFLDAEASVQVQNMLQLRRLGSREINDTTYRHKDGTEIAVSISGTALFDDHGELTGTLGIVRDVTERNKLQSQLMVSDRMASIGTLAAGVAHEINNPLAAVIGNLDVVINGLAPRVAPHDASPPLSPAERALHEEMREPLLDARDAAQRMRSIVRDLKMFSRASDSEEHGPVDIMALLESSLRIADNEVRHRAQVVRAYGAVPIVQASEARLGQVFLNLIVNAAQALPEGDAEQNEIRVSTRLEGDRIVIEVSDTGPGISAKIIGRIFDAFFTTKAVGAGSGLGLAISHRIVSDMGGELTVDSTEGEGTTFRVALPLTPQVPRPVPSPVEPPAPAALRGRILLVDDEPLLLRVESLILAAYHDVVARESAKEALALCAAGERFDLILCDLMMPAMTGMDLHRELTRVAPEQAARMIFLTGGAFTPAAQRFLADDSHEYVEKPFDSANLRAIIQRHLRSHA